MNETNFHGRNVNLLWTGGWDSTFQLLQLLTVQRRLVIPFYLIDANRRSTGAELWTMKRIKERLWREYPFVRELMGTTRYYAVEDIRPNAEITEAFQAVRKEKFLGGQYNWLARFCEENGIADIQLCIHRDDKAHAAIEGMVSQSMEDGECLYRFDPKYKESKQWLLFRFFSLPLFNLSKVQMSAVANEQGWKGIMDMTWFCHHPRGNMMPCGKCNPCLYTIEEGLGWRLPIRSRVESLIYRALIRPLKRQKD